MTELVTASVRLLQTLDWKHEPPCEMAYGRGPTPTVVCESAATVWLTYVNRVERVCRRLACDGCVARMYGQTRVIEVVKL